MIWDRDSTRIEGLNQMYRMKPFVFVTTAALFAAAPALADDDLERPRALLVGDSNMQGWLGHELSRSLRSMGFEVRRKGRVGTGLARPDVYDWMRRIERMVERYRPDVVIALFGGNDVQSLRFRRASRWSRKRARPVPWNRSTAWSAEYGQRLRRLSEVVSQSGGRLYLLSPTNRRPPRLRDKVLRVRKAQREGTYGLQNTWWIDTFALTSGPEGRYLARGLDLRGRRRVRYRKRDGIHLTRAGARALNHRLLPRLMADGLLQLRRPRSDMTRTVTTR